MWQSGNIDKHAKAWYNTNTLEPDTMTAIWITRHFEYDAIHVFASYESAEHSLRSDLDGMEPVFAPTDDGSGDTQVDTPNGEPLGWITATQIEPDVRA